MLVVGLSVMVFIMLRYVPSKPSLLSFIFLIMNGCWICQKLSCTYWNDHMILFFHSINMIHIFIDLCTWSHLCFSQASPTRSWDLKSSVQFGLLVFYWQFLNLYSLGILDYKFFFSSNILFWFWYQGNAGLVKWAWECSFLFNFLEEWEKLVLIIL